ncbi:DUF2934 domain-containing protein [Anabaena sp. PCC 7108]|uniref:DUF2934 domain-containing protein n=1 Tax=Anabaena sp. PCC 7108 TaxID=163908 RepID=UPI000344D5DC|nr:DUF2934 domain-containing protein [Anabaena sp. PCC 7108]
MSIVQIVEQVYSKYQHIENISYSGDIEKLTNECQDYLLLYQELWTKLLGLQNPFLSDINIIAEAIYYKTLADYKKKCQNRAYYRGNCSAFNKVIQNVIDKLQQENSLQKLVSIKLRGLIRKYMMDSLRLINHYQQSNDNGNLFQVSLSDPDYRLYYDTCEQIIFGETHFNDPSDQNEVSPALIRVMIELRLKWSMGISGYIVSDSPGNMSEFLKVYSTFVSSEKITVVPRFDIIKRIYMWGNIYIHTGIRSYSWLTGLALNFLDPLFYGEKHRLSGVRVQSQATIYEFWDELKHHYIKRSDNKKLEVHIEGYQSGFICTDNNCEPIPYKNDYAIYEKILVLANSGYQIQSAYNLKCILEKGIETLGNSLYNRVRESYVSLREKEIRERAYYLWIQRGYSLLDADHNWYAAIEDDINSLPKPQIEDQ